MSRGAHLTIETVSNISDLIARKDATYKEIAQRCGVSYSSVVRVATGTHSRIRNAKPDVNVVQLHGNKGGGAGPITPEVATMIKRLLADNTKTYQEVATATGVSAATVGRIFAGEHWSCHGKTPKRRGPTKRTAARYHITGALMARNDVLQFDRKLTARQFAAIKELLEL